MSLEDFNRETTIARLWRRLQSIVGRGRTHVVDDTGVVQTLQVQVGAIEILDKVPRVGEYGFASNPPPQSHGVVLFIAGDRSNGVVIATNHQASRLKNLAPGESAIFDDQGRWVWLKRGSIEIEAGNTPVHVTNATEVDVTASVKVKLTTPRLEVTGDIVDTSGSNAVTLKQLRDAYDAHKHTGVTAGGASTGTTDHPV